VRFAVLRLAGQKRTFGGYLRLHRLWSPGRSPEPDRCACREACWVLWSAYGSLHAKGSHDSRL